MRKVLCCHNSARKIDVFVIVLSVITYEASVLLEFSSPFGILFTSFMLATKLR